MMRQILELNESLRHAPDLDAFWSQCNRALERHGVSGVFFGACATRHEMTNRRRSKSLIWKTTYPQQYLDTFADDKPLEDDYTAEHCVTSSDLLFWHEDESWKVSSPKQRKRAMIDRDLGFRVGVTIPASSLSPAHIGGIGLSMPDVGLREFPRYWNHAGAEVLAICGVLDAGMRQQHMEELVGLSPREKECLTWLAAGLRPGEIADRLAIGGKSIEKYVGGAKRKLRATTRDHAVAKAIIFNLISP